MDTELLRSFIAVMRKGGFSAAARDLDVDPSSVSRAISALEEEVGVRLFQRTTRRTAPTEAGEAYFIRVLPLIEQLDDASEAARDADREPEGWLRLLSPAGFAQTNLLPLLPDITRRFPKLDLELVLTDEELDLVSERLDLAIRLWPLRDASHVAYRLCPMHEVICASPAYLAASSTIAKPEDLSAHRCVVFRQKGYRTAWRIRSPDGSVAAIPVAPRIIVSNAIALKECVLLGLGPTLVPRWIVGAELRAGSLVPLLPEHAVTATEFGEASAWLAYPSRSYLPLKVRAIVDYLKDRFRHGAPGEGAPAPPPPDGGNCPKRDHI